MHNDTDIIVQLRESFDTATHSLSTSPELPTVVRMRLRRHRVTRMTTVAVLSAAILGLALGTSSLRGAHMQSPPPVAGPSHSISRSPSATGAMKLASVAEVLDAASVATTPVAARGQYVHTHFTNYGMSQFVLGRPVDVFIVSNSDTWVPSDLDEISFMRISDNDVVSYRSPADRDYMARHAPGGPPVHREYWYSARGRQPYAPIFPNVSRLPFQIFASAESGTGASLSVWAQPTSETLAALPRDITHLRASLYDYAATQAGEAAAARKAYTTDDAAFDAVAGVLSIPDVPSDLRTALYGVAKTIPGIKMLGSMANYSGVRGIAIGRVLAVTGVEHDLIFDADTGTFIGARAVTVRATDQYSGTQGQPKLAAGTVLSATAISMDVTDKPVLPPGAKLP